MLKALDALFREEQGATMIEYAFIASLVTLAVIGGLATIPAALAPFFKTLADTL